MKGTTFDHPQAVKLKESLWGQLVEGNGVFSSDAKDLYHFEQPFDIEHQVLHAETQCKSSVFFDAKKTVGRKQDGSSKASLTASLSRTQGRTFMGHINSAQLGVDNWLILPAKTEEESGCAQHTDLEIDASDQRDRSAVKVSADLKQHLSKPEETESREGGVYLETFRGLFQGLTLADSSAEEEDDGSSGTDDSAMYDS